MLKNKEFQYKSEQFSDVQILRYKINSWDTLSLDQKKLAYYLYEAGLSGRDIIYDQNYRHNLTIRKTLETIIFNYTGERDCKDFKSFIVYVKKVWFSNGIHHHYSSDKFYPKISEEYFINLITNSLNGEASFPLKKDETPSKFQSFIIKIIFSNTLDVKKVSLDTKKDLIKSSSVNFYSKNLTQDEVESFYSNIIDKEDKTPISYGLNSKLVKGINGVEEKVYKVGGLYGDAIEKIVWNLEKAKEFSEDKLQKEVIEKLIEFYNTGDLKTFDEHSILWVKNTAPIVDFINGFIEVYEDPLGYKATWESVVSIKDIETSKKLDIIGENAKWFELNLPINKEHKRDVITDVTYKVINVIGESGGCSPTSPLGINLPNADWIRSSFGSKSVSLSNIEDAYEEVSKKSKSVAEFFTPYQVLRIKKHGSVTSKLHTCLHEIIGHGSGIICDGVGTPKETLKSYSSTLEEARADLVALYFIMDEKLVELNLIESVECAKAEYDSYIVNGLLGQLKRINLGDNLEESHMRNRQLIAKWAFEKGEKESVITKKIVNNKTFYEVNDYNKLRLIFGELLKEIQRIKSEGDYSSGKSIVEKYGVEIEYSIHKEVVERYTKLKEAPYSGFINPTLTKILKNGDIVDVNVEYKYSFTEQMLLYSKKYNYLK